MFLFSVNSCEAIDGCSLAEPSTASWLLLMGLFESGMAVFDALLVIGKSAGDRVCSC